MATVGGNAVPATAGIAPAAPVATVGGNSFTATAGSPPDAPWVICARTYYNIIKLLENQIMKIDLKYDHI